MNTFLEILAIVVMISVVHVLSLAAAARLSGIRIRAIAFGTGGEILRFGIVRLHWLPFGGHVKLKDSREETLPESECHDAYDTQPAWLQALIPLSACVGLFGIGALILGSKAANIFVSGFWQFVAGALAPQSDAQIFIGNFVAFMEGGGVVVAFGFLCLKIAAINSLPLPLLNGGDAVLALTRVHGRSEGLEHRLRQWSFTVLCALYGSWFVAIGAYLWRSVA